MPPTQLHIWTSKWDPKSWAERACLISKVVEDPQRRLGQATAQTIRCRCPAWGMFLAALRAPREGHAFQASPPRPDSSGAQGFSKAAPSQREAWCGSLPTLTTCGRPAAPSLGVWHVWQERPRRRVSVLTSAWASALILPAPAGTKPPSLSARGVRFGTGRAQRGVGKPRGMKRGAEGRRRPPSSGAQPVAARLGDALRPSRVDEDAQGTRRPRKRAHHAVCRGSACAGRQGEAGRRLYCTR